MKVDVGVQGAAKSLNQSHGSAVRLLDAAALTSSATRRGEHRSHEHLKDGAHEGRVVRETVAKGKGEGEHPLADRHLGKHAIDQMRSRVGHAPAAARRAERTPFARIRHEPILAAIIAVNANEAVREDAAVEELPQLALDEPRHGPLPRSLPLEERLELGRDNAVEDGFLGPAGGVAHRRLSTRPWAGGLGRRSALCGHETPALPNACRRVGS